MFLAPVRFGRQATTGLPTRLRAALSEIGMRRAAAFGCSACSLGALKLGSGQISAPVGAESLRMILRQ
jgi:hypothetical protein